MLCACEAGDSLERIQARGELRVVTRNSPTTWYLDRGEATGYEYAIARELAADLGVSLRMTPAFTLGDIFHQLDRREVDIAAAGLALTEQRSLRYPHSRPYHSYRPLVIYKAGKLRPRKTEDLLARNLEVLANSSHAELLRQLAAQQLPDLQWREYKAADSMDLMERVAEGQSELAIVDSHEFTVQQSLFPLLKTGFELSAEQNMVWYLPPGDDQARLQQRIDTVLQRLEADGTLAALRTQHFSQIAGLSRIGSHTFINKMRRDLPQYDALIRRVAAEFQLPWHLLAAVAYQESHWNPEATSPTGVRGLMMLTRPTARDLGVTDRTDPLQSLRGGARYLKSLRRRLPADITEPDRTWLALAAYNVGMGHLEDARIITQSQGGDPDRWDDVKARLPLLQKSSYYLLARRGYARGKEAVTYVENIRHYDKILQWQDLTENQPSAPLAVSDMTPDVLRPIDLQAL
jgi:membrane-bound lytic murein transglycosylase F